MATPIASFHGPGPTNVFVPSENYNAGATGVVQVEFSRRPDSFGVNKIAQLVPNVAIAGYYLELDTADAVRVISDQDFIWPDGNEAPKKDGRQLKWRKYATERRAYPFTVGSRTIDAARSWDIVAANSRTAMTQCMTDRTSEVISLITTAANWPTGSTAATLGDLGYGGTATWDDATVADKPIQKSMNAVVQSILQSTGGVVQPGDLTMTVSVERAHIMRETEELNSFIVNNESSVPAWSYSETFAAYGLPPQMYGVNINVDSAVVVAARRQAASEGQKGTFIMPAASAVFTSRVGGLVGNEGPNFSTVIGMFAEESTVETFDDTENRRTVGRVTDDRVYVFSSPISGYLIQDVGTV